MTTIRRRSWWGLAVVAAIVAVMMGVWAATNGGPPRPTQLGVTATPLDERLRARVSAMRLLELRGAR